MLTVALSTVSTARAAVLDPGPAWCSTILCAILIDNILRFYITKKMSSPPVHSTLCTFIDGILWALKWDEQKWASWLKCVQSYPSPSGDKAFSFWFYFSPYWRWQLNIVLCGEVTVHTLSNIFILYLLYSNIQIERYKATRKKRRFLGPAGSWLGFAQPVSCTL